MFSSEPAAWLGSGRRRQDRVKVPMAVGWRGVGMGDERRDGSLLTESLARSVVYSPTLPLSFSITHHHFFGQ